MRRGPGQASLASYNQRVQGSLQELRTKVDDTRLDADAAFDAAEHAMNVELAAL